MGWWWWLEPMLETSLILTFVAVLIDFIVYGVFEARSKIPLAITFILLTPLVASGLCALVNIACIVFYGIWSPYI